MPTQNGGVAPSVIAQLMTGPYRFHFFQAVRLLLQLLAEHGVARDEALAHFLRFDNSVSLSFPASEIEALSVQARAPVESEAALIEALLARQLRQIHITPAFIGLLGGQGALPIHYTARIAAHEHETKDAGPRALLDMFSSRIVTLLYAAWDKHRLEPLPGQRRDKFLPLLLALAGGRVGQPADAGAGGIPDEVHAYYGGLLLQGPLSPVALEHVLADYFALPFEVQESVGRMTALEAGERSALGRQNCRLGESLTLGPRVWRPDLRARLRVGPLDLARFEQFLPRTSGAAALKSMLKIFSNPLIVYEIELILRAPDVRPLRLDTRARRARLGWDCFLTSRPPATERAVRYELRLMEPLPAL
ncbi:MAG: type VI secretion system baseplate subunit TssG [Burkholderiaceae bacterium]|nr:type VI secretion system baseplate subunit TssG [Burkholderiaceae bacterium]